MGRGLEGGGAWGGGGRCGVGSVRVRGRSAVSSARGVLLVVSGRGLGKSLPKHPLGSTPTSSWALCAAPLCCQSPAPCRAPSRR